MVTFPLDLLNPLIQQLKIPHPAGLLFSDFSELRGECIDFLLEHIKHVIKRFFIVGGQRQLFLLLPYLLILLLDLLMLLADLLILLLDLLILPADLLILLSDLLLLLADLLFLLPDLLLQFCDLRRCKE